MEITVEELQKLINDSYHKGYKDGIKDSNTKEVNIPFVQTTLNTASDFYTAEGCKNSPQNPKNGGDGIYFYTLGQNPIYTTTSTAPIMDTPSIKKKRKKNAKNFYYCY